MTGTPPLKLCGPPPIGASGARVLTTLIRGLRREGKTHGVASLCIGSGL